MAESRSQARDRGYRYLHKLRKAAGMVPMTRQPLLETSAQNHADYLFANRATGHHQEKGRSRFTGVTPGDRARHLRFPHGGVSENVSEGDRNIAESIDGLMGAIYHRLGFLSFDVDQVGVGMVRRKASQRYVYNMALKSLTAFCTDPPRDARFKPPGRYVILCANKMRIRPEAVDALEAEARRRNPRVVLWPPQGSADIPPVFYEESPDPLPDRSFSGYPLSIQFNPAMVGKVALKNFRVFEHQGPLQRGRINPAFLRPITSIRLLSTKTDPNQKLTPLEFALFPMERLEWHTIYVGEAEVVVDGRREIHRWHFTTRDPGAPVIRLNRSQERVSVSEPIPIRSGKTYVIYLPPRRNRPDLAPFRYRHGKGLSAEVTPVDKSTLRLTIKGQVCDTLALMSLGLEQGDGVTLKLAHKDRFQGRRVRQERDPPEVLYEGCGKYGADYSIAGKGEHFAVRSGVTYKVHLSSPRGKSIGGIRWSFPQGVKVGLEYLPGDLLAVTIRGKLCQSVRFTLTDGRSFSAQVAKRDHVQVNAGSGKALAGCRTR